MDAMDVFEKFIHDNMEMELNLISIEKTLAICETNSEIRKFVLKELNKYESATPTN